jgi:DNA-binding LytR/AlgR family response regulator
MESAGNYVNLYSDGRIYPLRSTLADLTLRLAEKGFSRTHRSYAVNYSAIDHISYQTSGDGEIHLKNGTVVALSRRYKDEFKQRLA